MALSGHSPTPFLGPGSPPQVLNGHGDHGLPPPPPMSAPSRTMLPPSPQHYQPRYPPPLGPSPSAPPFQESRIPPPPPQQKRPGSSMSISSMLGGEPERLSHEQYSNHGPHSRQGSLSAPSMSLGTLMSPPHSISRPANGDYSYRPRSQTPDKVGPAFGGSRQRSASSGNQMMPQSRLYEHMESPLNQGSSNVFYPKSSNMPYGSAPPQHDGSAERARRTSLSGILQRPNSEPQSGLQALSSAPLYNPPALGPIDPYMQPASQGHGAPHQNGMPNGYDTRPPGMGDFNRTTMATDTSPVHKQSASPESRRSVMNGKQGRGLASLLNGPTSQPLEGYNGGPQTMIRQDSAQSQSDRSTFGERGRFRHYSPFAGSVVSQQGSVGPYEEQSRKGSDEIAHKAIVGLGLDNRRGRYSPVPQAVQGAQAQTPVPDGGVKSEQGRVFSGLGGGIGISPTAPTAVPGRLPASPFKRDAVMASQSDEYPNKMARTTSNMGKRARKPQDDDGDVFDSKKSGATNKPNKRTKYQNSYKADLEEMAASGLQRRTTPFAGTNPLRNSSIPANGIPTSTPAQKFDTTPIFKPKKNVKVVSVMLPVSKKARRHLGSYSYEPQIFVPDTAAIGDRDFDICIKPKLLPAFTETEHLNCTYTVRVSKTWLQDVERRIICSSRNLWGTGIYTDDSDPVAAAVHMGWIKTSYNTGTDETLMKKVIDEQNPKVEVTKDFQPPSQPLSMEHGKDLKITLVVMPQLERYEETVRFGVRSRSWPAGGEKTPHDGVSFAVSKVEFIDIGSEERRLGRTGDMKRKRLRAQIEARARAAVTEKDRLERIAKKQVEKKSKHVTGKNVQTMNAMANGGNTTRSAVDNAVSLAEAIESQVATAIA